MDAVEARRRDARLVAGLAADGRGARRRPLLPRHAQERHAADPHRRVAAGAVRPGARRTWTPASWSPGTRTCSSGATAGSTPARSAGQPRTTSPRSGRSCPTTCEHSAHALRRRARCRRDSRLGLAGRGVVRRRERPRARLEGRGDRLVRVARMRIHVGRVGKPHGLEGAFVVEEGERDPERFAVGATRARGRGAPRAGRRVEARRRPARDPARPRRSREARRSRSSATSCAEPGEGEYYAFQLVGLEVEDDGRRELGRVADVSSGPANDVLELDTGLCTAARRCLRPEGRSRREVESLCQAGFTPR